jgi:glucose/arabinose dehydrogenase
MRRHAFPLAVLLIALLVTRQIYPYISGGEPTVMDGYVVEEVAAGLGGPTCLVWYDETTLLVCDRDEGQVLSLNITTDERRTVLAGLDRPHGLVLDGHIGFVSEAGVLASYTVGDDGRFTNRSVLVDGVPFKNHQTNAVNLLPNGTLLWHSGSTCNICDEDDPRNAALLWVNASTGDHGVLASGVRNSFDGVWVGGHGYFFTDNGRDWEGDHPPEELNFLKPGAWYGWPDDDPEHPVPEGSEAPIGKWTPHTSMNGIDVRPPSSNLPGLPPSEGFTLYATVYGSWNTVLPQGHEILRIDVRVGVESGDYTTEITRFAWDAGTPLPLVFHPNGTLYYATFGNGGSLFSIDAV